MSDTTGINSENFNNSEEIDPSRIGTLVDALTKANFGDSKNVFVVELQIKIRCQPSSELEAEIIDIDHTGYAYIVERLEVKTLKKNYCVEAEDVEQAQVFALQAAERRFARDVNPVIQVTSCHSFSGQQVLLGWIE